MQRGRLDKFISKQLSISRRDVRLILAQQRVLVDGVVAIDIGQQIDKFSLIMLDNEILQQQQASYLMLHKPIGVVSATKDDKHQTVLDLIKVPEKSTLHLVGRLDLNTSGLVLLTNDSRWSQRLTLPESKVEKIYHVTLDNPLTEAYIDAFANGMYFAFEGINTKAAKLEIVSEFVAKVTLVEGRYHQIKRMFGRLNNKVIKLHRQQIGNLSLDVDLQAGQSRALTLEEVINI
ncbi:MAG: 16S rRNA pseudouridine516 synthase [Alteromonadaceae bacterium]|jgi:16S rRNA pseudouridine516 synthase